jgi:predicted Zn-dependent protease with MMP-like domain
MIRVFETVAAHGMIRLPEDVPPTAHCVVTVLDDDLETMREQARLELPEEAQQRMSELLVKNREGELTPDELRELDALAEQFDAATLTRGRALAALTRMNGQSQHD